MSGFLHPAGIALEDVEITDHGREPIEWSFNNIETEKRMINGRMRKWVVATKRTINVSWENLPYSAEQTADGHEAVAYLDEMWANRAEPMTLIVNKIDDDYTEGDQYEEIEVYFQDYDKSITKRGPSVRLWEVSATFVEV